VCEGLCSDFLANDLSDDSCRGALQIDPRPTTYNACRKGREKGFKDACMPSCATILEEDEGAIKLKPKPKPNSFAACDGSKNKKRRPNNPFARCRQAYEVAFEETQKGVTERAREVEVEAAAVLDEAKDEEADAETTATAGEDVVTEESVVNDDDSQPPITEDVAARQLEEPEEDRPTPYQAPPTDDVIEDAPKEDNSEDVAAIEPATSTAEVADEDKGSAAQYEEPATLEEIVEEPLDGPVGSETTLNQQPDGANGPTGPADSEPPTEVTIGPRGSENSLESSPLGMNGPAESISGVPNDDDARIVDAATSRNHVSLDSEKTPIVDL